ncbi:hypothetical protein C1H46_032055 [Malus baccata]|uniref:Protein transport protein SEC23 n=1 Tax=Malus baccata TaxID=106549 RepID=A0A540L7F1_MALBA|nr:hypothetical protein C1H46_032055 [Malus baccata]
MYDRGGDGIKSALKREIGLLPDKSLVGFVLYRTQVQVHELGFSDLLKVYVFRGSTEISNEQVLEQLGLSNLGRRPGPIGGRGYQLKGVTHHVLIIQILIINVGHWFCASDANSRRGDAGGRASLPPTQPPSPVKLTPPLSASAVTPTSTRLNPLC